MFACWSAVAEFPTIAWIMGMIVVVVIVHALVRVARMRMAHRERMAMIEKGILPDSHKKQDEEDED